MYSKEPLVLPKSDYYMYVPSAIAAHLYLCPIGIGYFYYEPGYYLKRNSYDSFLLMLIHKGTCTVRAFDKTYTVKQGQILILDCYCPHEYGNLENSVLEVSWLHFDGPLARTYYDLITSSYGNVLSACDMDFINRQLDKLLSLFRNRKPLKESDMSISITRILTEILNTRSEANGTSARLLPIENAISYITEHFSEPLTLEQIANRSNLSPYHFTRVFTAETGFTPHQYLIATRLNSAKFLLKTSALSVKEISFNCGFHSESSFCTTFRKWENMTPSEYRASGEYGDGSNIKD